MPRSKSKRSRYTPPPKKKHRPSPTWFGVIILSTFAIGVAMIVLNYLQVLPGAHLQANNGYLFGGLGLIAAGFLLSTKWY
jgi:cell division protein CrgA